MYIIFYIDYLSIMKKRFKHLFASIFVNGLILFLIDTYFPNIFAVESTVYWLVITYAILAVLLWFINSVMKRILDVLTIPLKYLTFWMSAMIIDMIMLYLFQFVINWSWLWVTIQLGSILAVLVLSLFLWLVAFLLKKIF